MLSLWYLWLVLVWVYGGLIEWVLECFFHCNFLKEFQKNRCLLFSKYLIEFTCEDIWSWTFVCWTFLNQFQFQYLWFVCSYFLFLPGSVLGDSTFLRIRPCLLGCPFYWHTVAWCSLLTILCISVVSVVTSFHFWFYWFELSPFFLMSLAKDLSVLFCLSFQRTRF